MSDKLRIRLQVARKLDQRQKCLLALRDARSGKQAHYGWLSASFVFNVLETGKVATFDAVQEALEYLADKGYVQFREGPEDPTESSDAPAVTYRISAQGQDLLDGVIENDPGVANY